MTDASAMPILAAMLPKPFVVNSAVCTQWLRSLCGVAGRVPYSPGSFSTITPARIVAKKAWTRATVTRKTIAARQIPSTANGQSVAGVTVAAAKIWSGAGKGFVVERRYFARNRRRVQAMM